MEQRFLPGQGTKETGAPSPSPLLARQWFQGQERQVQGISGCCPPSLPRALSSESRGITQRSLSLSPAGEPWLRFCLEKRQASKQRALNLFQLHLQQSVEKVMPKGSSRTAEAVMKGKWEKSQDKV